jgi:hypothetical protein
MIFWHVGGAVFAARWIFKDPTMDLRVLALGAVLPDLLDKPIGSLLFHGYYGTGRIYGHTLLFAVLVLGGVMVFTRRGTGVRKIAMALPIGILIHLVLDIPIANETLWWPLFGLEFPEFEFGAFSDLLGYLGRNPIVIVQEVVGAAYLAYLWRKAGLGDAGRRRELLKRGRLPITQSS